MEPFGPRNLKEQGMHLHELGGGGRIPWSYVGAASLYGGLYAAGILCLAILSFRKVEMK